MDINVLKIESILNNLLYRQKINDYKGYDKFDGTNSKLFNINFFNKKYIRFFIQQVIKEFPINLRPLFLVPKSRNIKGIALFSQSYLIQYELTKNEYYLNEAKTLIDWLIENKSIHYNNLAFGHNFIWEGLDFSLDKDFPNITNTVFSGEAFLQYYKSTKEQYYLDMAISVSRFIMEDISILYQSINSIAVSYFPFKTSTITLNIQAITAAFLIKLFLITKNENYFEFSGRLIKYVIDNINSNYSWNYNNSDKNKRIDNYHTAFILDSLFEYYEITNDNVIIDIYWKALKYYKDNLFDSNFIPKWSNKRKYPIDIHSVANAIITFSKASIFNNENLKIAEKILIWGLKNMYRKKQNDFIYRIHKPIKYNYSLVRWSNAWMAKALSEYLLIKNNSNIVHINEI